MVAWGILASLYPIAEVSKPGWVQSSQRTRASASLKVGSGFVAAVSGTDDVAIGQPSCCLQEQLPGPVRQLLVPPLTVAGVSLGGCQRGQERQSPNAPSSDGIPSTQCRWNLGHLRPRDLEQDHDRKLTQAARLDEMAVRRADRITLDAACSDLRSPPPFQRVVQTDDDGPVRDKRVDQ